MLLFTTIFISSCKEEEEVTQVILHSFGPSGVNHGDEIKFIGLNLDKVTAIMLPGAVEVNRSQFTSQNGGLITLNVPMEAEAGRVTLKTPNGDIVSKTMLSFNVPVVVNSITAEAKPGTNITITGEMVNWIEEVIFTDGLVVKEFVSKSLTELVVTVPMEAQTGFLIFKNGGTEPLSFASEEELIVTLPVVASIAPTSIKHTENLTITGTDLDLITSILFADDVEVTEFESQTETSIVVAIPSTVVKGQLTLRQASPIEVVTDELTIILPVATTITPSTAIPGTDNIVIKGTDLDLVASLTLRGIDTPIPASDFLTHTAEEISLALPEGATNGAISYTTIHEYSNNLGVNVAIPGPGPKPLAITLYDDEFFFGGQDWSWGAASSNTDNTEQAYSGTMSWKHVTAGGDGGAKAGNMSGVDASGMGVFVFSLYGGAGTDGKQVAAILGSDGADNWGSYNSVTLVEGEWTEYRLPLSQYSTVNLSNINIFLFKVEGATDATLYVDRVGFDPAGPTALDTYIFHDAPENGFGTWGGWGEGVSFDVANTENPRTGTVSIKANYAGNWGGAAQFGTDNALSTEGKTHFVFSIFGGEDTAGQKIRAVVKSTDGEGEKDLEFVEGEWTEIRIPLSELGSPANIREIAFQDNGFAGVVFIDRIGLE